MVSCLAVNAETGGSSLLLPVDVVTAAAEENQQATISQVPSKEILKTVFPVDFIYEGERYKFTATRASLDRYQPR
jgi:cellobiose-specific phosphotransferase system component IIB